MHKALALQAIQGGVHGSDGGIAPGSRFDFPAHLHTVSVVLQAENREHHQLLELSEEVSLRHFYKIESEAKEVKRNYCRP
jgi:hypothetical protein